MIRPDWIAVDWGTSNLRAWAMQDDGTILAEASSDAGVSTLGGAGFEDALLKLIGDWADAPIDAVACGMIGSRMGWVEAGYRAVPCTPLAGDMATARGDRVRLRIAAGLSQSTPPDVMRGEETQIAGFLSLNDGFDGVLCLPGTHTKWTHLSAGEVVSFRSFMTGEIFALLKGRSTLAPSLAGPWSDEAFDAAVSDAMSRPETLVSRLFGLRADHLLNGEGPAAATLSGLLIGAELAAARPYWLGQRVAVLGDGAQADAYVRALASTGATPERAPGTACTLAGLAAARQLETSS